MTRMLGKFLTLLLLLTLSGLTHAEKVTYYYTDPTGTVLAETDAQGNVTKTYDYRPYGEQALGQPPDGLGYTGHVNDPDTGLVYMQARYYDPEVGRFLSVDPAGVSAGDAVGFNRYVYANNSPLRFVDPDGRESADLTYRSVTAMTPPSPEASSFVLNVAADMTPVVGTVKGIYEAYQEPSLSNIGWAAVGVIPGANLLRQPGKIAGTVSKGVTVSKSRFPESAQHIVDAVAAGKPSTLTIDRANAAARRRDSLRGTESRSGVDRDEFPPAMFQEGGQGSSVRHINPSDNRGAGACIGAQCRGLPDGTRIRIDVVD
jgi:RHS repeat-associated protein